MAPKRKKKGCSPPAKEKRAKNNDGSIVCALCGKFIRSIVGERGVIYSICASCKLLPPRGAERLPS